MVKITPNQHLFLGLWGSLITSTRKGWNVEEILFSGCYHVNALLQVCITSCRVDIDNLFNSSTALRETRCKGRPQSDGKCHLHRSYGRRRILPKKSRLSIFLCASRASDSGNTESMTAFSLRCPTSLRTSVNSPLPPMNEPRTARCRPNSA